MHSKECNLCFPSLLLTQFLSICKHSVITYLILCVNWSFTISIPSFFTSRMIFSWITDLSMLIVISTGALPSHPRICLIPLSWPQARDFVHVCTAVSPIIMVWKEQWRLWSLLFSQLKFPCRLNQDQLNHKPLVINRDSSREQDLRNIYSALSTIWKSRMTENNWSQGREIYQRLSCNTVLLAQDETESCKSETGNYQVFYSPDKTQVSLLFSWWDRKLRQMRLEFLSYSRQHLGRKQQFVHS